MEERIDKAKGRLASKLDLPRDIILDLPRITIIGDNEITIENHKGIITFENYLIKINSKVGIICIKGENFEIVFIGGNTITLSGRFTNIIYEGK